MRSPFGEVANASRPMDGLLNPCLEMHLNPAQRCIEQSNVMPGAEIEIGSEVTVYTAEDVDVKGCGNTERIVIGGLQRRGGLEEIDADQQSVGFWTQAGEKDMSLLRGKIAD